MKIISPYKDYYDFIQGTAGMDERVVYVRTCLQRSITRGTWISEGTYKPGLKLDSFMAGFSTYVLAVCGVIYVIYWRKDRFYFGDEMARSGFVSGKNSCAQRDIQLAQYHLKKTALNDQEDCPVLMLGVRYGESPHPFVATCKNVKLEDFGFQKLLSPQECFEAIYNFLSRQPEIADTRTDVQRLEAHGFDRKTSFRGNEHRAKN